MIRPLRPARLALLTAAALAVAGMLFAQAAQAYKLGGQKWPTRTITYHAGGAPKYGKAIRQAVRAWNASGVRVRFRATSRRRARLRIFEAPGGAGSSGVAVLGWVPHRTVTERTLGGVPLIQKGIQLPCGFRFRGKGRIVCKRGPYVRLDVPNYLRSYRNDSFVANEMAVTVAHELGHVLGLKHVRKRCAVMYDTGNGGCAKPPEEWQLRCRLLESDDVRGAIRRYGGRMRPLAPQFCDASPAPGPTTDLVATFNSAERTVRVSWTNPRTAGIRFANVALRPGGCPPSFDDAFFKEVRSGERSSAKLAAGNGSGLHCVAVRGGDIYGRTGAPAMTEIQIPPQPRPEPDRGPEPEPEPEPEP